MVKRVWQLSRGHTCRAGFIVYIRYIYNKGIVSLFYIFKNKLNYFKNQNGYFCKQYIRKLLKINNWLILFFVKAAFGVAFGVLYRALTTLKKRSFGSSADFCHGSLSCALGALSDTGSTVLMQYIPDILWLGKTLNFYFVQWL